MEELGSKQEENSLTERKTEVVKNFKSVRKSAKGDYEWRTTM